MQLLIPSTEQAAGSPQSLLSVAITACVSVAVFWLGYGLNAAAAQRERRRKVIEDWFRALSKWVDDFGELSSAPDYSYNALTSREIIELSLPRRQRYLAWWMHEMAVGVMLRRKAASENLESRQTCSSDLNDLLRATGTHLLEWHHKKLRSADFNFSYQLRVQARESEIAVRTYAESRGLGDFIYPVRMTLRRQWQFQKLLLNPETGEPVLDSLKYFIRRKYLVAAVLFSSVILLKSSVIIARSKVKILVLNQRLRRRQRRLRRSRKIHAILHRRIVRKRRLQTNVGRGKG
ncbi:hypothetical protein HP499_19695 [Paenarthrobacter sp. CM16]|uniref:hypothetical protein n=1 Tax=Paenarthrobacter sp. CM16 TaxID=2738447 RepID=UPI0015561BD7|nr:hypothetical protein [Paenarthrobacter sp. CM16]NQD90015.1 hypothetical protein [Paenarthrobacter sp. CM16]